MTPTRMATCFMGGPAVDERGLATAEESGLTLPLSRLLFTRRHAWIAALSITVAIEKMAPNGDKVALALGVGLIVAGAIRLFS